MERPGHLVAVSKPGKAWFLHGLIGAVALAPILALMSFTPDSWWRRDGFSEYPGTYVRLSANDYRLCRPWGLTNGKSPPRPRGASLHVTTRFGSILGGKEANFAMLLPRTARVAAIYCGASLSPAPLRECSANECALALSTLVDDGEYTRGRGIVFGVQARGVTPLQRTDVGFWVFWQ